MAFLSSSCNSSGTLCPHTWHPFSLWCLSLSSSAAPSVLLASKAQRFILLRYLPMGTPDGGGAWPALALDSWSSRPLALLAHLATRRYRKMHLLGVAGSPNTFTPEK